ncbi:MAG: hypothetical protein O3C45_11475 [Bacteroidetes bacterium]|nr:hypothetical protein [Bacteroidota bacterium]
MLVVLPAEARQVPGEPGPAELRALILAPAPMTTTASAASRSPGIPFLASAVLPGAGQWINGHRVKALVAVSLEAAIITGYVVTRQNGLRAEDDFRAFAHDQWNPARYASWLNDYRAYLNDELSASITAPPVQVVQGVDFSRPSAWSATDRAAVQQMFNQITAIERQAFHPETGAVFSHQLPDFGDQQYYELIGKYFQFAPGWEDYPAWRGSDDSYLPAIDPELTAADGSKPNVSDTFFAYARDHADAQDLLRTASRISLLLVFNHIIAGIDAAVSAKLKNDRVSTQMGLAFDPQGSPQPVIGVRMRLFR